MEACVSCGSWSPAVYQHTIWQCGEGDRQGDLAEHGADKHVLLCKAPCPPLATEVRWSLESYFNNRAAAASVQQLCSLGDNSSILDTLWRYPANSPLPGLALDPWICLLILTILNTNTLHRRFFFLTDKYQNPDLTGLPKYSAQFGIYSFNIPFDSHISWATSR